MGPKPIQGSGPNTELEKATTYKSDVHPEPEMELEAGNLLRPGCSTQGWAEIRPVGPCTKNKLANLNVHVIFYMLSVLVELENVSLKL